MKHIAIAARIIVCTFIFSFIIVHGVSAKEEGGSLWDSLVSLKEQGKDVRFGPGDSAQDKGIGLVGPTDETASQNLAAGEKNGWDKTNFHVVNSDGSKQDIVTARMSPRETTSSLPVEKLPGVGSDPTPPGPIAKVGDFSDKVYEGYGYRFPMLPNGMLDLDKKPIGVWQPSVPPSVVLGGEGKLCIKSICNPDLSVFADRDKGSTYVITGRGIGGWSPFPTGGDGPRLCMNNSCVTEWKVPQVLSTAPAPTLTLQQNIPALTIPSQQAIRIDLSAIRGY